MLFEWSFVHLLAGGVLTFPLNSSASLTSNLSSRTKSKTSDARIILSASLELHNLQLFVYGSLKRLRNVGNEVVSLFYSVAHLTTKTFNKRYL